LSRCADPTEVVLVRQFGPHSTWAITTLTLVAGFASSIFQPPTAVLADHLGWRTTLVALAAALAFCWVGVVWVKVAIVVSAVLVASRRS